VSAVRARRRNAKDFMANMEKASATRIPVAKSKAIGISCRIFGVKAPFQRWVKS